MTSLYFTKDFLNIKGNLNLTVNIKCNTEEGEKDNYLINVNKIVFFLFVHQMGLLTP